MDQSILKDVLAGNVGQILPHLPEAELDSIADLLISEGVKKESDLRHMTVPLLKKLLDTVDASDLYVEWQNRFGTSIPCTSNTNSSQQPTANVSQAQRPLQERNLQSAAASELRNNRLPYFDKNSPYIPSRVREAINGGKRPLTNDRKEMIERIVDHCREKVPDLERADFIAIARQLVQLYEASFKDTLPISDTGHDSLAYQLQTKFDNDNRWLKKSSAERARQSLNRPEAFGCVQWSCDVPTGETEASLERKKNNLITSSGLTRRHWDWRKIIADMEVTFCLQRRDINGPEQQVNRKSKKRKRGAENIESAEVINSDLTDQRKTVLELKADWPFLFHAKGMNHHFTQLTGINFTQKLEDFLPEDGRKLINYLSLKGEKFESIRRKMEKFEARGNSSSPFIALVRLLQEFFKEPIEAFVSYVEDTTEYEEVLEKSTATLPKDGTPFLVVAGETLYDFTAIYLLVDSQVVSSTSSFLEAFLMWFPSYYVFNIVYSTTLASTLTYIQKVISEISTKGLKCHTAAVQKAANQKANKLSDTFAVYKAKILSENERNLD